MAGSPSNDEPRRARLAVARRGRLGLFSGVVAKLQLGALLLVAASSLAMPGIARAASGEVPAREGISASTALEQARSFLVGGEVERAESTYQAVLLADPDNLEAILGLARLYERAGKLEYARGLLVRATLIDPFDRKIDAWSDSLANHLSRTLHREVDSLIAARAYDSAIPKISILLTLEPESPHLHYLKALCHLRVGRPEAALGEVEEALRLRKDELYTRLHAEVLRQLDRKELNTLLRKAASALAANPAGDESTRGLLARILELDPDNPWARRELARLEEGGKVTPAPRRRRFPWEKLWPAVVALSRALSEKLDYLLAVLLLFFLLDSPLPKALARARLPRAALAGRLDRFGLVQVINLVHAGGYTGRLKVKAPAARGEIFFDGGEIYHSRCGKEKGREALKKLLASGRSGRFVFQEQDGTLERTIDVPVSLLLMDLEQHRMAPPARKGKMSSKKSKVVELLEEKS